VIKRKSYPTDVSDEEWSFAAPYLMLMTNDPPQLQYELREMFNALRWILHAGAPKRLLPTAQEESRFIPSTFQAI
jgi:transposase